MRNAPEILGDDESIQVKTDDNRIKIWLTMGELRELAPSLAEELEEELNRDFEDEEAVQ
jgi:hypothetical protein